MAPTLRGLYLQKPYQALTVKIGGGGGESHALAKGGESIHFGTGPEHCLLNEICPKRIYTKAQQTGGLPEPN